MKVMWVLLLLWISVLVVRAEPFYLQEDKQKHFMASAAIGATASGIARYYGSNGWEAFAIGVASSLLVGIAKERIDGSGYGSEDINDVYADTLGAMTGSAIMSWRF